MERFLISGKLLTQLKERSRGMAAAPAAPAAPRRGCRPGNSSSTPKAEKAPQIHGGREGVSEDLMVGLGQASS